MEKTLDDLLGRLDAIDGTAGFFHLVTAENGPSLSGLFADLLVDDAWTHEPRSQRRPPSPAVLEILLCDLVLPFLSPCLPSTCHQVVTALHGHVVDACRLALDLCKDILQSLHCKLKVALGSLVCKDAALVLSQGSIASASTATPIYKQDVREAVKKDLWHSLDLTALLLAVQPENIVSVAPCVGQPLAASHLSDPGWITVPSPEIRVGRSSAAARSTDPCRLLLMDFRWVQRIDVPHGGERVPGTDLADRVLHTTSPDFYRKLFLDLRRRKFGVLLVKGEVDRAICSIARDCGVLIAPQVEPEAFLELARDGRIFPHPLAIIRSERQLVDAGDLDRLEEMFCERGRLSPVLAVTGICFAPNLLMLQLGNSPEQHLQSMRNAEIRTLVLCVPVPPLVPAYLFRVRNALRFLRSLESPPAGMADGGGVSTTPAMPLLVDTRDLPSDMGKALEKALALRAASAQHAFELGFFSERLLLMLDKHIAGRHRLFPRALLVDALLTVTRLLLLAICQMPSVQTL